LRILKNPLLSGALRGTRSKLHAVSLAVGSRATRNARRQLAVKNAEISALKRELALARKAGYSQFEEVKAPVFFVLGYQKSGTTWLMHMLDAHPEILCKGEGRLFDGGWSQKSLKRSGVERPASSLYHALLEAEYLRLWVERSVWSKNDPADEHLSNLTRMAVDYFLEGELLKSGKKMVGDKSPLLTAHTIKEISRIYPEARVVHIIRDGRDTAVSAFHHSQNFGMSRKKAESPPVREASRRNSESSQSDESIFDEDLLRKLSRDWSDRVGSAVKNGPALLGDNYEEVRYEALVEKPEAGLPRLLEFLGASHDQRTARHCVEAASFEKLSGGRERGREDPKSFFRKGVVGDWENVFTNRDRSIFNEEAGELLSELGYETGES